MTLSPSFDERWSPHVEQIKLQTHDKNIRVIGLLACEPCSGTTSLAHALAHVNGSAGIKSMLLDVSGREQESHAVVNQTNRTMPGTRRSASIFDPIKTGGTYDVIIVRPSPAARKLFNNITEVRTIYAAKYETYAAIVVDLPPATPDTAIAINPMSAAVACDGVVIVCMSGRLNRDLLERTCQLLKSSGANLLGVVTNELMNPSLGAEFAREARRLRRISPRASAWLARKALAIRYIN